jgi:hypothetical protein
MLREGGQVPEGFCGDRRGKWTRAPWEVKSHACIVHQRKYRAVIRGHHPRGVLDRCMVADVELHLCADSQLKDEMRHGIKYSVSECTHSRWEHCKGKYRLDSVFQGFILLD